MATTGLRSSGGASNGSVRTSSSCRSWRSSTLRDQPGSGSRHIATAPSTSLNTFAFVDRDAVDAAPKPLPDGWRLLDDDTLLSALDRLGEAEPLPLAATTAFEKFLTRAAAAWGDEETASLSVEFLIAFGRELTSRLDLRYAKSEQENYELRQRLKAAGVAV